MERLWRVLQRFGGDGQGGLAILPYAVRSVFSLSAPLLYFPFFSFSRRFLVAFLFFFLLVFSRFASSSSASARFCSLSLALLSGASGFFLFVHVLFAMGSLFSLEDFVGGWTKKIKAHYSSISLPSSGARKLPLIFMLVLLFSFHPYHVCACVLIHTYIHIRVCIHSCIQLFILHYDVLFLLAKDSKAAPGSSLDAGGVVWQYIRSEVTALKTILPLLSKVLSLYRSIYLFFYLSHLSMNLLIFISVQILLCIYALYGRTAFRLCCMHHCITCCDRHVPSLRSRASCLRRTTGSCCSESCGCLRASNWSS